MEASTSNVPAGDPDKARVVLFCGSAEYFIAICEQALKESFLDDLVERFPGVDVSDIKLDKLASGGLAEWREQVDWVAYFSDPTRTARREAVKVFGEFWAAREMEKLIGLSKEKTNG